MPIEMEYFEDMMKSDLADMKNSGGRWGGAITAACFLKQFVDPKIPWAHIDIAGPAIFDGGKHYNPPGASGVIVRTLLRYLETIVINRPILTHLFSGKVTQAFSGILTHPFSG